MGNALAEPACGVGCVPEQWLHGADRVCKESGLVVECGAGTIGIAMRFGRGHHGYCRWV